MIKSPLDKTARPVGLASKHDVPSTIPCRTLIFCTELLHTHSKNDSSTNQFKKFCVEKPCAEKGCGAGYDLATRRNIDVVTVHEYGHLVFSHNMALRLGVDIKDADESTWVRTNGKAYGELFADLLAVLHSRDGSAVAKALDVSNPGMEKWVLATRDFLGRRGRKMSYVHRVASPMKNKWLAKIDSFLNRESMSIEIKVSDLIQDFGPHGTFGAVRWFIGENYLDNPRYKDKPEKILNAVFEAVVDQYHSPFYVEHKADGIPKKGNLDLEASILDLINRIQERLPL